VNPRAIYNGRPVEYTGPPIQIYHPAFATFIRESLDTTTKLTPELLNAAKKLIGTSLAHYPDALARRKALESLNLLESIPTCSMEFTIAKSVVRPDGSAIVDVGKSLTIPYEIMELKNEIGTGGMDPHTQAEYGYASIFCTPEVGPSSLPQIQFLLTGVSQRAAVRKASCCPAILVGIAGPHLTVAGAIFGDKLTTQRLTDYVYLGPHPSVEGRSGMDKGIRRVARILRSLKASNEMLKDHYSKLKTAEIVDEPGKPMTPHFRSLTIGGVLHQLKYTRRLSEKDQGKAVFLAELNSDSCRGESEVVVKFAHSYCGEAHRLLADSSLAPRLLYCEKVKDVGMYVVVMGLAVNLVGAKEILNEPKLARRVTQDLQRAVQILHDADFVHGDLREPNILVQKGGNVQIIDYDWCGKEGEVYYPADINDGIQWADGVYCGGPIKKEHDKEMVKHLFPPSIGQCDKVRFQVEE
jgi:hypothetical protein